jgi:hypothetical protein
MDRDKVHEYLWGDFSPQAPTTACVYYREFKNWADTLCAAVGRDVQKQGAGAVVAVNQAYVLLLTKYFDWRLAAPKAHRNYSGEGHLCLFHCFDETYRTLRAIELSLTPPLLLLPPPTPARTPRALSIADVVAFGAVSPLLEDWS